MNEQKVPIGRAVLATMIIGDRLRAFHEERGFFQKELKSAWGCSGCTIPAIRNSYVTLYSESVLAKIRGVPG
jgi:hypothetical protein